MKNYLLFILFVFTNILFAQNPADSDGVLYPTPTAGINISYDAIATYPDGRTIIGGNFTSFTDPNGTQHTNLGNIIRLNEDGSRDTTFNPGGIGFNPMGTIVNPTIKAITIQPDGKILVGGHFTSFNGLPQKRLIRLNEDGTKDSSFNTGVTSPYTLTTPGGDIQMEGESKINTIILQSDGKILVGGQFTKYNNISAPTPENIHANIVRLNADGTKDTDFIPVNSNQVYSILIHDNKILVTGSDITQLKRLNMSGLPDNTFAPGTFGSSVNTVAIQPDGKILVGGAFQTFDGLTQNRLIRLNDDGTKDTTFNIGNGFTTSGNPTIDYTRVLTIKIQADQKILVGGQFTTFNGETSNNSLVRLNADGTKDTSFDTQSGFNTSESLKVSVIKTQPDGKVVIGGTFNNYQNTDSNKLIRLKGTNATLDSDSFNTSDIKVSLYPNPTTDYLNISTLQDITSYDIYDINGRSVLSKKTSDKTVSVSSLSNGMYIIAIKTDSGQTSSKFIKQ